MLGFIVGGIPCIPFSVPLSPSPSLNSDEYIKRELMCNLQGHGHGLPPDPDQHMHAFYIRSLGEAKTKPIGILMKQDNHLKCT